MFAGTAWPSGLTFRALATRIAQTLGLDTKTETEEPAVASIFHSSVRFGACETVDMTLDMNVAAPQVTAPLFAVAMAIGHVDTGLGQPRRYALVDRMGVRNTRHSGRTVTAPAPGRHLGLPSAPGHRFGSPIGAVQRRQEGR